MEFKDYYKIMGVARDATQDEIKRSYRKLARKYHPDVSKETDAEIRFKALGEAYQVLKDAEKRSAYDQLGDHWKEGQEFRPPPDWNAGFEFGGSGFDGNPASNYSDFFSSLFGRDFRNSAKDSLHSRGLDSHAKVLIDLEDSYQGATRTIILKVQGVNTQGNVIAHERVLNVTLPKGIRAGQRIRLAGQGETAGADSLAGDLYIEVEFRSHPLYRAEGRDIYLNLPVTPWEAVLGATVKVPTLGGIVELKIPQGSAAGRKLRLKGRGLPGDSAGDCFVVLCIALPPADTDAARNFYQSMAKELYFNPRVHMGV